MSSWQDKNSGKMKKETKLRERDLKSKLNSINLK